MISHQTSNRCACILGISIALMAPISSGADASDQSVGYYPTYQESGFLATGDYDYERGTGGVLNGPDLDRLAATGGIWPYEYNAGQLSRLQRFMQPVDYILRPLTPGETIAFQGPTSESWLQLGGAFPFLTRTYHPEKSSFADLFGMEATQYSPFFFDVLNISAFAAYVDNSGLGPIESRPVDGAFLSAVSLTFRAGWGLTDRTSLIIGGQVFFIITDETDIRFFVDAGQLGALVNFNYQFEAGTWDFRVFDDLRPFSARNAVLSEAYSGDLSWGGRYWMGIPDTLDSGDWWSRDNFFLMNTAGVTAGTWVGQSLRFLAGFSRFDTMKFNDLGDDQGHEMLSAGLFYDGYELWVAPSLTYTMYTTDFASPEHQVMINGVAPLSPNITVRGGVGYSFGDLYDGFRWSAGIQYNQTARLTHQLNYESGYQNAVYGKDFTGDRLEYGLQYQLGSRVTIGGYAGWFSSDSGDDGLNVGGTLNVALGNYSWLRLTGGYLDSGGRGRSGYDPTMSFYNITFARRLAERLEGQLSYEYIQNNGGPDMDRSIMMLRVTRTF